jgi:hypothetical protein
MWPATFGTRNELADVFAVNTGRISEYLKGHLMNGEQYAGVYQSRLSDWLKHGQSPIEAPKSNHDSSNLDIPQQHRPIDCVFSHLQTYDPNNIGAIGSTTISPS